MKLRSTLLQRAALCALAPRDWFLQLACARYRTFVGAYSLMIPRLMESSSRLRARRAWLRAARAVPAYASYVASAADSPLPPETDKESYIKAFPTEQRCRGGALPLDATMIDESSSSTGTPYNWVRTRRERRESQRFIAYFARYCYGDERRITINAFSMGAWATGINMGQAMESTGIVKNTGPDLAKIFSTLRFFGPNYAYLILGYPPFLKHLIDEGERTGFPFERYRLDALVGGEGMSEGLRDYVLQRFRRVFSGYGATDLEIGMAGETPISVALRRLARRDPEIKRALFGDDSRLPMVFQYNPLMHHIEVNDRRELIVTITRGSVLSPRLRYNVHDEGGVARFDEMAALLKRRGIDLAALGTPGQKLLRLPFVWVYGRRDSTVSVMGANIYPEDIEQCVYSAPRLARVTRSYCLGLAESAAGVRPRFVFEVDAEPTPELAREFAATMVAELQKLNADFREALREYPETLQPDIQLYRLGEGPFAGNAHRIKQLRMMTPGGA